MNKEYFDLLLKVKDKSHEPMSLFCPESNESGSFTPFCLLDESKIKAQPVFLYEKLESADTEIFKGHHLRLIKMQAGLGSSVKRHDVIKKYENREHLGSKGTDLFFPVGENNYKSVVSLQVLQANYLKNHLSFSKVKLQFLVNEETTKQVASCIDSLDVSMREVIGPEISQEMMPTISESGELTRERIAPAGHGFIGFREIYHALSSETDEIICIGNGEDLNSTPDDRVLGHVIKNEIPVVMITTTKTSADLKGGQMGIKKKEGENEIISIFEKAQAEESNQLEYFEKLGLREQDGESFFNTNMAIINTKPLRDAFKNLDISVDAFMEKIAPEVIKNVKIQDGKRFTQLESALGSVLLNMNSFFTKKSGIKVLHLCNVGVKNRYKFFLPIKKREDYDLYLQKYTVTTPEYVLGPKE